MSTVVQWGQVCFLFPISKFGMSPIATLLLLFIIASLLWHKQHEDAHSVHSCPSETPATLPTTLLHQNIAVASVFGWHFNVYLLLIWSMQRVLKGQGNVQVYADTPFEHNFQNLSDELGLYRGTLLKPLLSSSATYGETPRST